jgi:hypothetical protein
MPSVFQVESTAGSREEAKRLAAATALIEELHSYDDRD